MQILAGMLVAAFLLFIATKAGFATVKFHKRAEKPSGGTGGVGGGGGGRRENIHHR